MSKLIVTFGELLWDLFASGPRLGGAPANFAYRVHTLGERSLLISGVGEDRLGEEALRVLRDQGMDSSLIQRDPAHPTGTVQIFPQKNGDADYLIVPDAAYDHVELNRAGAPDLSELFSKADAVYFGTLAQRRMKSRSTLRVLMPRANAALKILDINLRKDCFSPESIRESIALADVLKLNDSEIPQVAQTLGFKPDNLADFASKILVATKLQFCLTTLGAFGAYAAERGGGSCYTPGYEVAVVDTVGSGDAFSAGFIHKLLAGDMLQSACEFGNALGALVATREGAMAPIPTAEMDELLKSGVPRRIHHEFA